MCSIVSSSICTRWMAPRSSRSTSAGSGLYLFPSSRSSSSTPGSSQGRMRSLFSNTRETVIDLALDLEAPPLNMRSVILPALTALGLLGPRTNMMASPMFDFPDPLGPVIAMYPSMRGTVTFPPNDLKFSSSICLRYIPNFPFRDRYGRNPCVHPITFAGLAGTWVGGSRVRTSKGVSYVCLKNI